MTWRATTVIGAILLGVVPLLGATSREPEQADISVQRAARQQHNGPAGERQTAVRVRIEPVALSKTASGEILETSIDTENTTAADVTYSTSFRVTTDRGKVIVPDTVATSKAVLLGNVAQSAALNVGHAYGDGFYVVHADVTWSGPQSEGSTGDDLFIKVEKSRLYVVTADDYYLNSAANEGVQQP